MNLICKIFGHKECVSGWYESNRVHIVFCIRCNRTLESRINPMFSGNFNNLPKMVCKDKGKDNLTVGKTYEILDIDYHKPHYYIRDDKGAVLNFEMKRFTTIAEYRKLKLKQLNERRIKR